MKVYKPQNVDKGQKIGCIFSGLQSKSICGRICILFIVQTNSINVSFFIIWKRRISLLYYIVSLHNVTCTFLKLITFCGVGLMLSACDVSQSTLYLKSYPVYTGNISIYYQRKVIHVRWENSSHLILSIIFYILQLSILKYVKFCFALSTWKVPVYVSMRKSSDGIVPLCVPDAK